MANSSPVNAGDAATAAQYNSLRLDVLDPATGHHHDGTDSAQLKLANNVGILGLDSGAVARTLLKLDASNVLQVGGTGMTVNVPVATTFAAAVTFTGAQTYTQANAAGLTLRSGASGSSEVATSPSCPDSQCARLSPVLR